MKRNKVLSLARYALGAAVICATAATPFSANASLIGDSVDGTLGTTVGTVTTQFASPAVVGAGPEFAGVITDVFDQVWDIVVDFGDSSFTVDITEQNRNGTGNVTGMLDLDFTDLDWVGVTGIITDVTLSDYTCNGTDFACNTFDGGPDVSVLGFGDHSVSVSMNVKRDGEIYTFDITAEHVPEPTTLALAGLGLLGIACGSRRRA